MEQIEELWPSLFAALIVPLVAKVKALVAKEYGDQVVTDIPILWYGVSAALSVGFAFFLKWLVAPEAPAEELVRFVLTNIMVVGITHASFKTPKKVNGGQ